MYLELPRPTIFAHRGAKAHAPENTLAAFHFAVKQGAPAIELDAKLSADGEIVIFHDLTLDRTTNGTGPLKSKTLAELKELDAGSYFSTQYQGEKIPTLAEVFEAVGQQAFINIELTNYASPKDQLPDKVVALVQHYGYQDIVMFSSFNHLVLQRAHQICPEIPLGLLAYPGIFGAPARSWIGRKWISYQALHPATMDAKPKLIQKAHQLGKRVHVYTVNLRHDMIRLYQAGVDGIFTDDPSLALDVLKISRK
jgi:glycerophosphoryl diester phosphodiesterase